MGRDRHRADHRHDRRELKNAAAKKAALIPRTVVGASLFNRVCFNYPTLGELYKFATYEALLKRAGLFPDAPDLDKAQIAPPS